MDYPRGNCTTHKTTIAIAKAVDEVEVSTVISGSSPSTVTVGAKASPETQEKAAIPSYLTAWVDDARLCGVESNG